jgi:hypothetical protein
VGRQRPAGGDARVRIEPLRADRDHRAHALRRPEARDGGRRLVRGRRRALRGARARARGLARRGAAADVPPLAVTLGARRPGRGDGCGPGEGGGVALEPLSLVVPGLGRQPRCWQL